MLGLAVVGLGRWGIGLARSVLQVPGARLVTCCDADRGVLERFRTEVAEADVKLTTAIEAVLGDDAVDAVVIATPIATHYTLARKALDARRHVLVQKPMAQTSAECRTLISLARDTCRILQPSAPLLYSPAVRKVKELLDAGRLGSLYFATASRVGLEHDESAISVVRDLAPHDYSVLHYWLGTPSYIRAIGRDSILPGTLDVVFADLGYPSGALVHVELSWLAPVELQRTVLVGSERMIVLDDDLKIYDRGIDITSSGVAARTGGVETVELGFEDPLVAQLIDFTGAIRERRAPEVPAGVGLDVVRMLEATEASLLFTGAPMPLEGS